MVNPLGVLLASPDPTTHRRGAPRAPLSPGGPHAAEAAARQYVARDVRMLHPGVAAGDTVPSSDFNRVSGYMKWTG